MRSGRNKCQIKRISITSASAANALDVIGFLGRHRREDQRGEVSNIDTHLERGCCRNKIWMPRSLALNEQAFKLASIISFENSRMFAGNDTMIARRFHHAF